MNTMNKCAREILTVAALIAFLSIILILISSSLEKKQHEQVTISSEIEYTIIIDAGHGGEDGGTSSKSGILEKDLNLTIAKKLYDTCNEKGLKAILTREDDKLLYDPMSDYKGKKKILDMQERLRIANATEKGIFISIHMNAFPEEKYKGLQVYYSPNNSDSQILAKKLQENVAQNLQSFNKRQIKNGKDIFLLNRLSIPAVLIECGFLSNTEEAYLLTEDEYQNRLVSIFFETIRQEIQKKG